jgi:hypothetical protein
MPGQSFQGLLIANFAILAAISCPAHATDSGEKQVAAAVGFAMAGGENGTRPGMQASVEAALGFTDAWAGRVTVSSSWQPEAGSRGPHHVTALSLGTVYSLDVVRWVPFLDLGFSLADLRGNGASSQRLGPQAGLGVEYQLSRRWTLAALVRFDYFALRLRGPGGTQPWLACAALRVGRVF